MDEAVKKVEINPEECTGCGICLESCKRDALKVSSVLNHYGVHPVQLRGELCEACGTCYYLCPEPGAITLFHDWEYDKVS